MPAFAPGRVNLIGEHTDYNGGLALAFAIEQGVRVTPDPAGDDGGPYVRAVAAELGIADPPPVRIESDLPAGEGLSSSAALCVAAALALGPPGMPALDLAELCRRAEERATGIRTGLLDQLAILLAEEGQGVLLDFSGPDWELAPLDLGDTRVAVIPSGAPRLPAAAGYAERQAECEQGHPARMRHVASENERVRHAVDAVAAQDMVALGALLDASHASLRDDFEVSVPDVERTVARAKAAGALGARIMGGGFGGSVLALFGAGAELSEDALEVRPAAGARSGDS